MIDTFDLVAKLPKVHYLDGAWIDDEPSLDVINPATAQTLTQVSDAAPELALTALDAAVAAQDEWATTDPRFRGEILRAAFAVMGPEGRFIQFTYGPVNPVAREVMGELDLHAERTGFTLWNVPPAAVYVISRSRSRRVAPVRAAR